MQYVNESEVAASLVCCTGIRVSLLS